VKNRALLAVAAAVALVVATQVAAAPGKAVVKVRPTALGRILVDTRGRTLYLFEADRGRTSACYGKCGAAWPPLVTSARPTAAAGAKASLLGTTARKDGRLQVTYRGHPLYFFAGDTKPGQTKGQDVRAFGGEWYVVSPAGAKVESQRPADSSGSTDNGGSAPSDPGSGDTPPPDPYGYGG
jgi:predicted lipoprotein with Yx(FWY)xxD motif